MRVQALLYLRDCVKSSGHPGIHSLKDRSCGGDVEDEVVVELDDSPGTTKRTKFSVLQKVCVPFPVRRGSRPRGH